MEVDHAVSQRTVVEGPAGPLETHVYGAGPAVVLIASLGRGAEDFADLAARLAAAGFCALALEPRGVGASTSPLVDVTMAGLADDVAAVIRALADGPATVAGHAFGNRVARMVATTHGDLVESVVLLACGGLVPPAPEVTTAMVSVFDARLDPVARLDAIARAFFAPGHDPSPWEGGWHAATAAAQAAATAGTPVEDWWTAGSADVLVVQPAADVVAVPENATRLVELLGERAQMVTIPGAGHALLPEQPAAVAEAMLGWLDGRQAPMP
jgi:pimeloyl-ACP methyl ester carboxylesterase